MLPGARRYQEEMVVLLTWSLGPYLLPPTVEGDGEGEAESIARVWKEENAPFIP